MPKSGSDVFWKIGSEVCFGDSDGIFGSEPDDRSVLRAKQDLWLFDPRSPFGLKLKFLSIIWFGSENPPTPSACGTVCSSVFGLQLQ